MERPPATTSDTRARVLIIDDHPVVREALSQLIASQPDLRVWGEAGGVEEALRLAEAGRQDVAVVDVVLHGGSGIELTRELLHRGLCRAVVIYSMHEQRAYVERALQAGASGYVTKSEPARRVVEAIRKALQGELYISPAILSGQLRDLLRTDEAAPRLAIDRLTLSEYTVFQLLGEGYGVSDIADKLQLSPRTVESYRGRAKGKLGARDVMELLQMAVQYRLGEQRGGR